MSSILPVHPQPGSTTHYHQTSSSSTQSCPPRVSQYQPLGGQEAGSGHSSFANGLPTPPASQAMTGVTLKSNQSTANSSYNPPLGRYPLQDVSSDGLAANRHGTYRPYERSGRGDQITGYRAGGNWDLFNEVGKIGGNVIASSFQIPESINSSKGSIAEFAAEITCLFWFESAATVRYAEELSNMAYIDRGLVSDALPSIGFRKWVTTILTTTLVGKNVILLALLFIYRLKSFNPTVSGKQGSEFRLLTIALMLGNKFLDDNTYTNKTWAEVSGISVTEIHIMEVEFLSNMRYDLYVSESDWGKWKVKLGQFGAFLETASRLPFTDAPKPAAPTTPVSQSFPTKLPSPPSTHQSTLPYHASQLPTGTYPSLPTPFPPAAQLSRPPSYPDLRASLPHDGRKRSLDPTSEMPLAKRLYHAQTNATPSSIIATSDTFVDTPSASSIYTPATGSAYPAVSTASSDGAAHKPLIGPPRGPRLPVPRIQTTMSQQSEYFPVLVPSLPPPGNRAMSSVYAATSQSWSQVSTPVSNLPMANMNLYSNPIPNLGDAGSRAASALGSVTNSPVHGPYGMATPTRSGLSPSYFLTHRSSPYRPVRNVNTLLIAPPSASMNNPSRTIGHDQIRYQPLSKAGSEERTGVVPYLRPDAWSHGHTMTPPVPLSYEFRA